ncbi:MAG: hypothetical protein ABJC63_01405 [Gemmatimonadales bacterium]
MPVNNVNQQAEYRSTLLRLNARAWGIAVGLISGIGLFAATILLIFKGGEQVGAHLSLIGKLLPGYRVSIVGAFIGFAYMFMIGYAIGRVIGSVYNRLARGG